MSDAARPAETDQNSPSLQVTPGVDFPMPPKHLLDDLDNEPAKEEETAAPIGEVAELDYVDGEPLVTVALERPFRLDGRVVDQIVVRPLTVHAVAGVIRRVGAEKLETYHFYAEMTGLPAPVVRALIGEDGARVTQAGWDFLPQFVRKGLGG